MKKITVITLLALFATFCACGQQLSASKVPAAVKTSFSKQFPKVVARWGKEGTAYEASFKKDGHTMSAVFLADGSLKETETVIKVSELPAAVQNYMKVHYKGMPIKEAAKIISSSGALQYEAAVKGKDVLFDPQGNFIKEVKD